MEHWNRVQELFKGAVELAPGERGSFLQTACAGDYALRLEIEELLAADSKNGEGIFSAIETEARSLFGSQAVAGSRLGAYRVIREIGRGGMGTVYLAVRADDQYEKEVAIKLIRPGLDTQDVLDRFRHERQILANLEHPYIARLLDGGTSADGRPFLVMEYLQGEPLDVYCGNRKLTVQERLRLFLKVCEAVAFAHRNLVVHRDLKPGNILVTEEGSPKLLDFGVAKLLDRDTASARTETAMAMRRITPDYASPEQIRGERMTTATDVYSLGNILYELLSGKRPQNFSTCSPQEVERLICEVEPPRLSETAPELRKQFAGDLDAIVSKAMRKEPHLRYASVEMFAVDVERYLNGEEVEAHRGSFAYRAGKFRRRYRTPLAIGALFAAVLIGGSVIATREAILATRAQARAELERRRALENETRAETSRRDAEDQAREALHQRGNAEAQRHEAEFQRLAAETQRQIAERRFGQVRKLAGKFLVEFHDAIAKLPGSTQARKMVVESGLEYYDGLVRDAEGNRELLEEIARGYDRLGDVQGNPYYANLGDVAAAIASYRKALAVRGKISDPSPEFLRDRVDGETRMAQVLTAQGNMKEARRFLIEGVTFASTGPAASDYLVRKSLANLYNSYGALEVSLSAYGEAEKPFTSQLAIALQLAAEARDPVSEQTAVSVAHSRLGDLYTAMERNPEALTHLRTALEIDKRLAEADPNSAPRTRKLFITFVMLGRLFRAKTGAQLAQPGEAAGVLESAAELGEKMMAADPDNHLAVIDLMNARMGQGDWLRQQGQIPAALVAYRKAVDISVRVDNPQAVYGSLDALVQANQRLAAGLRSADQSDAALESLRKAEDYLARANRVNPGTIRGELRKAEIADDRAEIHLAQKRWNEAMTDLTAVISIFETQRLRDPRNDSLLINQPGLYARLADCYEATGQREAAVRALQSALDRTAEIEARRPLVPDEERERQAAVAKLSQLTR